MKKILLLLTILSFLNHITAQVKVNQNAANSAINTSSAFMDASSSPLWNGTTNQGKGMLYPRVDLVNYTAMSHAGPFNASNNPNYFDGLLVFNTATGVAGIGADSVFPGYYYYRNTTTTANGGHWVSLKGIKGDDGAIGPIGPQGVQGLQGPQGLTGLSSGGTMGCYTCPTMISGISASSMGIGGATSYCSNLTEGGYTNWRIPTLDEFEFVRDELNLPVSSIDSWTKDFQIVGTGQVGWTSPIYVSTNRNILVSMNAVCVR